MQIYTNFCLAISVSYLLIWFFYKTPIITLFKDKPGARKVHQRIIPRIGGLAITISFLVALLFWDKLPSSPPLEEPLRSILIFASLAILPIGLADDMVKIGIKNGSKFIVEILIAAVIVLFFDICLDKISFLKWEFNLGWAGIPLSIIWIVGVTNALNIIDGLDGLAGSIIVVIFATMSVLTAFSGDSSIFALGVIIAGLVTGFLFHNISPARVFLGDTGSLFLGLMAGFLSLYLVSKKQESYPVIMAPLMLGLPVLDITVAMWRRFMSKIVAGETILRSIKAMTVADNEHIHHRLVHRGLTHTETVLILVLFHLSICICSVLVCFTSNTESIFLLLYTGLIVIWFLTRLNYFDGIYKLLKKANLLILFKKEHIGVICHDDILQYSLRKYKQNRFVFSFKTAEEIIASPQRYSSVIIEQQPDSPIENSLMLASTIFMQNACPVVVVCSSEESIPAFLERQKQKQKSFLLVRKPVYIPSFLKEMNTLINHSRGWTMERLAIDTRKFFLQVEMHEKF